MLDLAHDASGLSLAGPASPGSHPSPSHGRPPAWALDLGNRPFVRRQPPSRPHLDRAAAQRRSAGLAGATARTPARRLFDFQAAANPLPTHHRPLPRPVETSLLSVDAGSGGRVDRPAVWGAAVGLDGGTAAGQVGLHAAKAHAPGLRAGLPRGRLLAAAPVSVHSRLGPPGEGADFLGGRNGLARRPRRRSFFSVRKGKRP